MQTIHPSKLNQTPGESLMVPYRALPEDKRSALAESLRLWDTKARELEDRRDDLFYRMAQILDEYLEELLRLQQENNDPRACIMNSNSAPDSLPIMSHWHTARGSNTRPSSEEELIPLLTNPAA